MGLDHGPRGQVRGGKQVSTAEMINHELAACWEMCCEAVGIDTDATAAEWREAYEAKRAQVRREAAEPHLRKKWAEEVREKVNPPDVDYSHEWRRGFTVGAIKAARFVEGAGNE